MPPTDRFEVRYLYVSGGIRCQ